MAIQADNFPGLRTKSREGVSVNSPPLEGVVKSLRSGRSQNEERQLDEPAIIQLGLEFNQFFSDLNPVFLDLAIWP